MSHGKNLEQHAGFEYLNIARRVFYLVTFFNVAYSQDLCN